MNMSEEKTHEFEAGALGENASQSVSSQADKTLKASIEAIIYVADDPVTTEQIVRALEGSDRSQIVQALLVLQQECRSDDRGIEVREVAGGYKMFTKPEHHELLRRFVKSL